MGKVATLHNVSLIVMACSVDQTVRFMNPRIRQTDKIDNRLSNDFALPPELRHPIGWERNRTVDTNLGNEVTVVCNAVRVQVNTHI